MTTLTKIALTKVFRCLVPLCLFFCSLSAFSHQMFLTEAEVSISSKQRVKLTMNLSLIDMVQQIIEPAGSGFMPGSESANEVSQAIENVRSLSETELDNIFRMIQDSFLSGLMVMVDDQRLNLRTDPFPTGKTAKAILSQSPTSNGYSFPFTATGDIPQGGQALKVKFPSQLGFVQLDVRGASSMLVESGRFSSSITLNHTKDAVKSKRTSAPNFTTDAPEPPKMVPVVKRSELGSNLAAIGANSVEIRQPDTQDDAPADDANVSLSVDLKLGEQVATYLYQGVLHIIPKGLDHILFVLALFLLSTHFKPLLWQVTVFTLAHTITLLLAGYQIITAPASVVEPLIALSIAFVALENLFHSQLKTWRMVIIFAFGLLHGLGFASVLLDLGLPQQWALLSLVSFNVGVEVGQLFVVAGALLLVGWFRQAEWYRKVIALPSSVVIASIGLFWTIERVMG